MADQSVVSGAMEPRSNDLPLLANVTAAMKTVMVSSPMVELDAQAAAVAGLSSAVAVAPILPMLKTPISCEPASHVAVFLLLHFDGLLSWSGHAWT